MNATAFKKAMSAINALIESGEAEDYFFGIRATTETHHKGEELANSYVWIDGEKTDEELRGTCAIGIDSLDEAGLIKAIQNLGYSACKYFGVDNPENIDYIGKNYVLIAGYSAMPGEDKGESIIGDRCDPAFVVEVL